MKRSSIVRAVAELLAMGWGASWSMAQQPRANVITIVTDDQARWGVGAYGNSECRTPNMDRLAREGAKFSNAFVVTPVCSPSRASFLTGLYGTELGITDWLAGVENAAGMGLPAVPTWPQVLHDQGYATALVGKWHLGTLPQFHPTKHGFDHFFGFLGGGQSPMDPTLERDGKEQKFTGPIADILASDAIKFIEDHRQRAFAVCLMFREPHQPYTPMPEVDNEPFKELDPTIPKTRTVEDTALIKRWTREYYAAVHAADRNIGRLLDKLDELGLAQNTVVLFTSDHGYMIGQHSLHTKGNAAFVGGGIEGPKRPNMFDYSLRVPLIIRYPALVKAGSEIPQLVTNLDTFATILGLLEIKPAADVKQHGVDFSPLLRGQSIPDRKEFFGQYDLHNGGLAYMRMIRADEWKLVHHHFSNGLHELYNLKADPQEMKNLYADETSRQVRDDLQSRLTAWQQSINDPLLHDFRSGARARARTGTEDRHGNDN